MKKRILIVVSGNYDGAIARCAWNLYSAFLKHPEKFDVKCVLFQKVKEEGMKEYENIETYNEQPHTVISKIFPQCSKAIWLHNKKGEFKPDYTISTLNSVNIINVLSGGKDKKIGIFHSPHQQGKASGAIKYVASLFSYNFIFPCLDKLACVSSEVKESLKVFPLISGRKTEIIYNIHDVETIISKSLQDIMTDREKMIFSNPTLLYCGRMDHNKVPERALLAFAKSEKPSNAQIVFVGVDKANLVPKLYEIAEKYGISEKVHILGKKNNPYPYFSNAQALVSSSYSEGLPGVMIESLILGTPVVTTNSSKGIWEIFSAANKYEAQMDGIFENECGIISSNLAYRDKTKEDYDIERLKEAIERIWLKKERPVFKFKDKVLADTIIEQLIN